MSRVFNFILISICCLSLLSIYKVYYSYTQQYYMLTDLNDNNFIARDWDFVEKVETDYPNLSITAIPLKALLANYYLANDSIVEGFNYVEQAISEKSNPFIGYPEAIKAKLYNTIGTIDSAVYFSGKAFRLLPRNPLHFSEYARSLTFSQKYDSITEYFKLIKEKPYEPNWRVYLASISNFMDKVKDTAYPKQVARESLKLFPNQPILNIAAYYVLAGRENTVKALDLEKAGAKLLEQNKFDESITILKEADSLLPINVVFKENISVAYFNLQEFESVIKNLNKVELSGHELDGIQNYMMGLSYFNTMELKNSCNRLLKAIDLNFAEANNAWTLLCSPQKNQN